jgi:hypothetical protein
MLTCIGPPNPPLLTTVPSVPSANPISASLRPTSRPTFTDLIIKWSRGNSNDSTIRGDL